MTSLLHVNDTSYRDRRAVPAAAVWDWHTSPGEGEAVSNVRTLQRTGRALANVSYAPQGPEGLRDRIEHRRERGRTYLLGAVCGFVMVIGTVVGLDQSADHGLGSQAETVTAITAK